MPGEPRIIYVGHASAGLFKSTDGGVTFRTIFDGQLGEVLARLEQALGREER